MESGNASATDHIESKDSKTHPAASPGEGSHVSPSEKPKSRSHSSCSSSSDEETIQIQLDNNSAGAITSNAATQATTEQQPDAAAEASSHARSSSRIPSYVFATKSSSNVEWSVASNESLFSIHTGNMSFTRDQMNYMYKSGELGYPLEPTFSGPLIDLPSSRTPGLPAYHKSGNLKEEYSPSVTEAAAAETMREVMREKESQAKDDIAKGGLHSPTPSQHSDTSVKSFAFPILTAGDSGRSCSLTTSNTKNKKLLSRASTPKAPQQSPPETLKPPQTPAAQTTPNKDTRNAAGPRRWFSCFPCCSSCS